MQCVLMLGVGSLLILLDTTIKDNAALSAQKRIGFILPLENKPGFDDLKRVEHGF